MVQASKQASVLFRFGVASLQGSKAAQQRDAAKRDCDPVVFGGIAELCASFIRFVCCWVLVGWLFVIVARYLGKRGRIFLEGPRRDAQRLSTVRRLFGCLRDQRVQSVPLAVVTSSFLPVVTLNAFCGAIPLLIDGSRRRKATNCSGMSVKSAGSLHEPGGPIVCAGYLKKLKTSKKKWFVLRSETCESPARLEYYDSEKKFNGGQPPKRIITLRTCFNINKRSDTKYKYVIALYTKDDCFCVVLDTEEELDVWLKALLSLQHGEEVTDGETPKPTFGKRFFTIHVTTMSPIRPNRSLHFQIAPFSIGRHNNYLLGIEYYIMDKTKWFLRNRIFTYSGFYFFPRVCQKLKLTILGHVRHHSVC